MHLLFQDHRPYFQTAPGGISMLFAMPRKVLCHTVSSSLHCLLKLNCNTLHLFLFILSLWKVKVPLRWHHSEGLSPSSWCGPFLFLFQVTTSVLPYLGEVCLLFLSLREQLTKLVANLHSSSHRASSSHWGPHKWTFPRASKREDNVWFIFNVFVCLCFFFLQKCDWMILYNQSSLLFLSFLC